MAELEALRDALSREHANPVADDMNHAIVWYLNDLPGPGETKEKDGEKSSGPSAGDDVDLDAALPDAEGDLDQEDDGGVNFGAEAEGDLDADTNPVSQLAATSAGGSLDDVLPDPDRF